MDTPFGQIIVSEDMPRYMMAIDGAAGSDYAAHVLCRLNGDDTVTVLHDARGPCGQEVTVVTAQGETWGPHFVLTCAECLAIIGKDKVEVVKED